MVLKAGVLAMVAAAIGLGVGALLWAGDSHNGKAPAATKSEAGSGDLFVIEGTPTQARATGHGTLAVGLKNPSVLWFSDRPARLKGTRPIGRFVAGWKSTFSGDPPNAAVVAGSNRDVRTPALVAELQQPRFDPATGVAEFELKPEGGASGPSAAKLRDLLRRETPTSGRLVLFIDNGGPAASPSGVAVAAAYADAKAAINVLRAAAAGGGASGAAASADLKAIAAAAGTETGASQEQASTPADGSSATVAAAYSKAIAAIHVIQSSIAASNQTVDAATSDLQQIGQAATGAGG